ncbi:MAG: hypothetical protein EOP08_05510, partial [Proteobacteria bacterium]
MSLARTRWFVGFVGLLAVPVLGAACGGEEESRRADEEEDGTSSGASGNLSSGNGGSSGTVDPDSGVITGPSTTVTGTTFAPNGATPLAGVSVTWSRTAPAAIPVGPFCSTCAAPPAGTSVVSASNGAFTLTVPVDEDVFVTTQIGNFRRVRAYRFAQSDIALAQTTTTLPGRTDPLVGDNAPAIGVLAGEYDTIANSLDALGVKSITPITLGDLGNLPELQRYQVILVPGGGGTCAPVEAAQPAVQSALRQFVALGGTLYATDYSFEFVDSALPGFVQFAGSEPGEQCTVNDRPTGRYDDPGLAAWLGAAADGNAFGTTFTRIEGTLTQQGPGRDGQTTSLVPKVWATATSGAAGPTPVAVGIPYGCGTGIVASITAGGTANEAPASLGNALSYILFKTSDGCVAAPAPSCAGTAGAACTPGTPPVQGAACGFCGTAVQRCSNECRVLASSCENEQLAADRCVSGATRRTAEGCALPGEVRTQTCHAGGAGDAARCTWSDPPAGVCAAPVIPFVTAPALGATVTRTVTAAEQQQTSVPGGTCGGAQPSRLRVGALT